MSHQKQQKRQKTLFYSPKKQPLVKKMILDPYEANIPSSCYELRPIHQHESNQNDMFDPRSSSMKQISQIQKNSPHQIDKIIYDQSYHNHANLFISAEKQIGSPNYGSKQFENNNQSLQQISQPLKRQSPICQQDSKKYEKLVKIFQVVQQTDQKGNSSKKGKSIRRIYHNEENQKISQQKSQKSLRKSSKSNCNNFVQKVQIKKCEQEDAGYSQYHRSIKCFQVNPIKKNKNKKIGRFKQQIYFNQGQSDGNQKQIQYKQRQIRQNQNQNQRSNRKMIQQSNMRKISACQRKDHQQVLESLARISQSDKVKKQAKQEHQNQGSSFKKKKFRKITQNAQYQLINQYVQLMTYVSLIQDMIAVYDKSPIFQNSLDFQSDNQELFQIKRQNPLQDEKLKKINPNLNNQPQNTQQLQVKIEAESEYDLKSNQSQLNVTLQKQKLQTFTLFEKLRIQQAPPKDKRKIIKQIKFQRTKNFVNFYQPIQQLKPYLKKMTIQEKTIFIKLKKQLKEIKQIIDYFQKKNALQRKQHICKICGEEFESGRQLGGHMSRKHPGKAIQYGYKRQLQKVKQIERNRRKYFKRAISEVKLQDN